MKNVVNIEKIKEIRNKRKNKRILDICASFTVMSQCLSIIDMNDMPELNNIKKAMHNTVVKLKLMEKNERR